MSLGVIIAAGGVGSRMGGPSKQFMHLAGRPVLAHTLAIFEPLPSVDQIVIAIEESDVARCREEIVERFGFNKVGEIVPGGESRGRSVANALSALGREISLVAIHDGARPLFPAELLDEGLLELEGYDVDGVVYGLPVNDTIKEADPDTRLIAATPARARLWAAQTPQIFTRKILEEAFEAEPEILNQATDDASLVERIGGRLRMLPGSRENIKLTEPLDVLIAEMIIENRLKSKS